MTQVNYSGGRNIAIKVPPHQYEETVRFYRDTLGLEQVEDHAPAIGFKFGSNQLWIDNSPSSSQAEIWLEIVTEDKDAAVDHLAHAGVVRCDAIEPLGPDFKGFWISSPPSIVHLVNERSGAW